MTRIRRAVGLVLGDYAYDHELYALAEICYFKIAGYPRRMRWSNFGRAE